MNFLNEHPTIPKVIPIHPAMYAYLQELGLIKRKPLAARDAALIQRVMGTK